MLPVCTTLSSHKINASFFDFINVFFDKFKTYYLKHLKPKNKKP